MVNNNIDFFATELRKSLGITGPIANVGEFVGKLPHAKVEPHPHTLLDLSLNHGLIRKHKDGSFTILTPSIATQDRINYNLAYALGHLILHLGSFGTDSEHWESLKCFFEHTCSLKEDDENHCFALSFLMPKQEVLAALEQFQIVCDYSNELAPEDVKTLSNYFSVPEVFVLQQLKWLDIIF